MHEINLEGNQNKIFSFKDVEISCKDKKILSTLENYQWFVSLYIKDITAERVGDLFYNWIYKIGAIENLKMSATFLDMFSRNMDYFHFFLSGVNVVDNVTLYDVNRDYWSEKWWGGIGNSSLTHISLVYKDFIKNDDFLNDRNYLNEVFKINKEIQKLTFVEN